MHPPLFAQELLPSTFYLYCAFLLPIMLFLYYKMDDNDDMLIAMFYNPSWLVDQVDSHVAARLVRPRSPVIFSMVTLLDKSPREGCAG